MTDIIFSNLRKVLVATIALMFAFVVVYTPQEFHHNHSTVPQAEAFIGTFAIVAAITAFAVQQYGMITKEFVLDPIAWAIAKQLVAHIVSDLVDWINSGFKGSPAFITNFQNYLLEAADKLAGHYLEKLGGAASFLCSPFRLNIQVALATAYDHTREDGWTYEGCTLSDIVGNLEDFVNGNFVTVDVSSQSIDTTDLSVTNENLEKAWQNWNKVTNDPETFTPYGAYIKAQRLMEAGLAAEKARANAEASWGAGMQANKKCSPVKDSTGHEISLNCVILTPAKQISDALTQKLGLSDQTLVTADEISELVGALISQLGKKAITGAAGLLGLSKGTGYTYGGFSGGSYTGAASAEANTAVDTAKQSTPPGKNGAGGSATDAATNLTALQDAYTNQVNFVQMADRSIAQITAYINNSSNPLDKRSVAQEMLYDATGTRQNAQDAATQLNALLQEYTALNTEYLASQTTDQRKADILAREQQIMNTFNSLNLFTASDITNYSADWNTANL